MELIFRSAIEDDLGALVGMLANDPLGQQREDKTQFDKYQTAFAEINRDPNNELIVAVFEQRVVGMLQLTYIPYLTHQGSWRCLIEGVRVDENFRGQGLGERLFQHAIELAKERDCNMVQLTSDKQRPDALRFYEKLGFIPSHEGFKLKL
ncbi:GNAT family N-acetyltransferase [Vibrio coralliilyticus]|uniref:GNAT family N-acetyltransferase n=1 Tax=Vibrio coralliilyticus TaxID=190893 RepID=UPI000BAAD74F|nr:GNAT family N-acetyltransferase [Vibrio coralliilyticus]NOI57190.1 GNAT family N-acetyltransferase [Vibrio coralliilyticus]PAT69958.1 GNAT family N-acetyltransferase [Vibrio coralliilyticus]